MGDNEKTIQEDDLANEGFAKTDDMNATAMNTESKPPTDAHIIQEKMIYVLEKVGREMASLSNHIYEMNDNITIRQTEIAEKQTIMFQQQTEILTDLSRSMSVLSAREMKQQPIPQFGQLSTVWEHQEKDRGGSPKYSMSFLSQENEERDQCKRKTNLSSNTDKTDSITPVKNKTETSEISSQSQTKTNIFNPVEQYYKQEVKSTQNQIPLSTNEKSDSQTLDWRTQGPLYSTPRSTDLPNLNTPPPMGWRSQGPQPQTLYSGDFLQSDKNLGVGWRSQGPQPQTPYQGDFLQDDRSIGIGWRSQGPQPQTSTPSTTKGFLGIGTENSQWTNVNNQNYSTSGYATGGTIQSGKIGFSTGNRTQIGRNDLPRQKLPTFDGSNDWDGFIIPFNRAAKRLMWEPDEKLDRFIECLRGQASKFMASLSPSIQENFDLLTKYMENRFSRKEPPNTARKKLSAIRQKSESNEEFAEEVRRLVGRAYPSVTIELQEELAAEAFLNGYKNARTGYEAMNRHPKTVSDALDTIAQLEHNFRATIGRDKEYEYLSRQRSRRISWQDQETNDDECWEPDSVRFISRQPRNRVDIKGLQGDIRALKDTLERALRVEEKPERTTSPEGCFQCGDKSHFKRDCPKRSRSPSPMQKEDTEKKVFKIGQNEKSKGIMTQSK